MKMNELVDVEELREVAEVLDEATDELKEKTRDNCVACLADIDPDVLETRINLIIQQCYLQSFAVMKLAIAKFASENEDEDIETALTLFMEMVQKKCTEFAEQCQFVEILLQISEIHVDKALDELQDDE